jgi:hypothetical protein
MQSRGAGKQAAAVELRSDAIWGVEPGNETRITGDEHNIEGEW